MLKLIAEYNAKNPATPLPDPAYVVELKFDGLTLNLTYQQGQLVQASTRGKWTVGEGILAQIKTIKSIPLEIPYDQGTIEVQGEGIMFLSVLEKYNQTATDQLKNARTPPPGALRNLNPKVTAERKLNAFFYNIGYSDNIQFENHADMVQFLRDNHFKVSNRTRYFATIEEVSAELERLPKNGPASISSLTEAS